MKSAWGWTVLGWLAATSPVVAGDGEPLAPDQLPPVVTSRIREAFGAEPLHGRKEVEGGEACYVVTAMNAGRVIEIYASPDGHSLARKTEEFSLTRWLDNLDGLVLFVLLSAMAAGASARGVVRAARGRPLSVSAGWVSSWVGAGAGLALMAFSLATVPRVKDVAVLSALCGVWGALAASAVEGVVLAVHSGRGGVPRRRSIAGCCALAAVSLALSIPLEMLRIERENRSLKALTLRPWGS